MTITTGKIAFTKESLSKADRPTLLQQALTTAPDIPKPEHGTSITCYPRHDGCRAQISYGRTVHLGVYRAIDVEVNMGKNDVTDADLLIRPISAGLHLRLSEARISRSDCMIAAQTRQGTVSIRNPAGITSLIASIPYEMERDATHVSVRLEVRYQTKQGNFIYRTLATVNTSLHVEVNVQDFFRQHGLISKFTINTASTVPIHLLSSQLVEHSGELDIQACSTVASGMVVFAGQPGCSSFIVTPRGGLSEKRANHTATMLQLTIQYETLLETVMTRIESNLYEDLRGSDFISYSRLIIPQLLREASVKLALKDYKTVITTGEMVLPAFSEATCSDIVLAVPMELRQSLSEWLRRWYKVCRHRIARPSALQLTSVSSNVLQYS